MAWYRRLLNQFRSNRLSDEIDRELEFHVAERADALMADGMSEQDARREARRRFGNYVAQKERTRETDLLGWLETLFADVRYAIRALRGSPGFALVAILSLALGIGANTAIFSLVDALLLRSLPVHAAGELLRVNSAADDDVIFTNPLWEELRDRQDVFTGLFAYSTPQFNLATGGEVRPVAGNYVSGDYFRTLGVTPAVGRLLTREDDRRGCAPLSVLGHGFWRSEYGGDPAIVGRTIALNGKSFQIIGVSSASFFGVEVGLSAQVFVPLCANAVINGSEGTLNHRSLWWLRVMGRPKAGLGAEQVAARLKQLAPSIFAVTVPPRSGAKEEANYRARTFGVSPAAKGSSSLRNQYSRPLTVLMVVVGVVLLIACANVANLLLARATARQREIAVRLAIGAGRGRILRQLLTESLLLSGLGALLGVLFALWGNRALVALLSTSTEPIWLDLSLDMRVLGFALLCALTTGLLFGIAPAWRAARIDPYAIIKANARSIVHGESRFGLGKALVAAQIGLSLTLIMTAALLLGTFRRLSTVELGFNREGVLIASVNLRNAQLPGAQRTVQFTEMLERSRALPGVRAASVSDMTPISGGYWNENLVADGFTPKSTEDELIWMNQVSSGYFATIGMRLLFGRDFDARDVPGAPAVAIISESAARKFFAGRNPIGQHYRTRIGDELSPPIEVIGVVQDAKYRSLKEQSEPLGYLAMSQRAPWNSSLSFELVSDRSPNALIAEFTTLVLGLQPRASLTFATMERQLAESITRERSLALLSSFFGGLALLLAIIGLYGVISYNVARRRNEIGIRVALGSPSSGVLRLILGEVTRILVVGLALGAIITLASTRLISTLLYGVTPYDPRTLAFSALVLASVALAAGALPAIRASRLDPMSALRED